MPDAIVIVSYTHDALGRLKVITQQDICGRSASIKRDGVSSSRNATERGSPSFVGLSTAQMIGDNVKMRHLT